LLTLPLLLTLTPIGKVGLVPLALYALAVLAQGVVFAARGQVFQSLTAVPLVVLTHILYGVGFWRGLFTLLTSRGQQPPPPVVLETVPRA
jgi:hypothetical protein